MKKFIPYGLIAIVALVGFYVKHKMDISAKQNSESGVSTKTQTNDKIDNKYATLLIYPKKNPLRPFTLVDQNNKEFSNQQFKGKWNLIFSGYTYCPDVCPNALNQMTQLYNAMEPAVQEKFQIVFLSVDPERDTPEHMKGFLNYFSEDFVGITGEFDQLDIIVKDLGGIYSINKEEGEFYTVDHSARIFIVGPQARRYGILQSEALKKADKSQLIADLSELLN